MLEDRIQMGKQLGQRADMRQFLCGEFRLDVGVGILGIGLWRQLEAGHRFTMQLELQPPHIHVRVIGDAQRSGVLLQQHTIALVVAFLAFGGLVVEARHERLATAKAIA